eukprot:CAMPEP_0119551202 /NCGR_PEP_ID=MMETSP1352-20130426/4516_1 /TAXON_ID=265584 /ORGANISM="Stauroneis constricta, Strain CCMP1120" /LENGTH=341 /DNA_ID=CAMNT_0007597215 /DNA_START=105 /DNA_END=1130 /DNA_ORIENTATION=-
MKSSTNNDGGSVDDDLESVEVHTPNNGAHVGTNGANYGPPTSPTPTSDWYNNQQRDGGVTSIGGAEIANAQLPMMGQFCAAILVLIAITTGFNQSTTPNYNYGVAVGIVAVIFSLLGIVLTSLPDLSNQTLFSSPVLGSVSIGYLNALLLFVWWFVAACVLTFDHPFEITGNGYFATWAGLIFSVRGCGITSAYMKSAVAGIGPLLGLMAASVVVILAVPSDIGKHHTHNAEAVFALVLGIFTPVLAFVLIHLGNTNTAIGPVVLPILAVLSVLWLVMASLVTFRGPFKETGNGYFAAWAGAAMAILATNQARIGGVNSNDMTEIRQTNSHDTADTDDDGL